MLSDVPTGGEGGLDSIPDTRLLLSMCLRGREVRGPDEPQTAHVVLLADVLELACHRVRPVWRLRPDYLARPVRAEWHEPGLSSPRIGPMQ